MQLYHTSAAITKITRRITMHKNTRSILGKPFSNKGKNPTILCYILKRRSPNTIDLTHKRVLTKT
jgi:hypothetical protein